MALFEIHAEFGKLIAAFDRLTQAIIAATPPKPEQVQGGPPSDEEPVYVDNERVMTLEEERFLEEFGDLPGEEQRKVLERMGALVR